MKRTKEVKDRLIDEVGNVLLQTARDELDRAWGAVEEAIAEVRRLGGSTVLDDPDKILEMTRAELIWALGEEAFAKDAALGRAAVKRALDCACHRREGP